MPGNPYYQSQHWKSLRKAALKRDGGKCATRGCVKRATFVDHIKTRPPVSAPTSFDVLRNMRCLCSSCDAQIKERNGKRMRGGAAIAKGCGPDGIPYFR